MISVIIPVYNVEKYLSECIESVINQTFSNLEIILVDDGSTDESGNICDKYAQKDKRIKVIHKGNGGLSSARNAGIEIAKGDYYAFIDSDDYVARDMIEQLYYALKTANADMSICRYTSNIDKINTGINYQFKVVTKDYVLKCILKEKSILTVAVAKLYKKKLFNFIRYPQNFIYEDLGTTYKLVEQSDKIVFTNVKKYYYRDNMSSITGRPFSKKNLDFYIVSNELHKFIKDKYPKLFRYTINNSLHTSIAFMRKISVCSFDDKNTIDFLVSKIRKNIFGYLFSGYSIFSKMYGVLICINTQAALKLFRKNRS